MSPLHNANLDLRILVLDDDETTADVVAMGLVRLGLARVSACGDGGEFLRRIDAGERFDIVLLDLGMPGMDGIEVLRNLATRSWSGAIWLFSGEDPRLLNSAQSLAGAHGLRILGSLSKPVSAEDLKCLVLGYEARAAEQTPPPARTFTADELREALDQRSIVPYFQPLIKLEDQSLAAIEVLARWVHPEHGLVLPDEFIPLAEERALIDDLAWCVIEPAMRRFARWRRREAGISLGLNLSVCNLEMIDLPERLAALVKAHEIPNGSIVLEITESKLMLNLKTSLDVLTRLRLGGFDLSIDDFGTGYSSISQLRNIPFNQLKIDRAFVRGASADASAQAILELSAALAKNLDMVSVAEGIEDRLDWGQAVAVGCDLAQGFFIAAPMAGDEFDRWLKESRFHRSLAV